MDDLVFLVSTNGLDFDMAHFRLRLTVRKETRRLLRSVSHRLVKLSVVFVGDV